MKTPLNFFPMLGLLAALGFAAASPPPTPNDPPEQASGFPPPFGPGGFGPGGLGGPGPETKLVKQFDQDGDQRLNSEERKAARAFLAQQRANRGSGGLGGPGGRRGGFGPPGQSQQPATPGAKLSPAEVKLYPDAPVYDPGTLRTFFLEFEDADWEKELADFKDTDVEVPARLIVDGKTYPEVGGAFPWHVFLHDGGRRPEAFPGADA